MSRHAELIRETGSDGAPVAMLRDVAHIAGRNVSPANMPSGEVTLYSLPSFDRGRRPERISAKVIGSAKTMVSQPAVLVPKLNPHIPRVWRLDEVGPNSYCSTEFYPLQPDNGSLEIGYLYYAILSRMAALASSVTGSTNSHKRLHRDDFLDLRIPIPSLEIQREIVSVLDTFAALEAELEAELETELEARRRQYEHYRDTLLNPDRDEREWLTLRDVAIEFGRGKSKHRPRNDPQLYGGRYPFIQTGDIRNSRHMITAFSQTYNEEGLAQSKLWPRGTVCITIAANIAETGILNFAACFPDSVIGLVVDPEKASQYFVEYLLQSFKAVLAAEGRGTAQANINLATFENERFPFPPLKEQERIVSILDNFDALLTDLSVGIPAELAARRKQYEYYRDRLLTFPEAS